MGALALTAKAAYREPFEPLPGDVTSCRTATPTALADAVTDRTAAVILEPLQGEAGVVAPPLHYLAHAREITSEHGALLWLDEIQTGIGRTGAWYAHQSPAVASTAWTALADIVTVAKGLAGGFPIGACIATGEAADLLAARQPRHHVRRQPGRRGGGTRGPGHDREGGPARARHRRWATTCATGSPPTTASPRCAAPGC